jgi:hypothetical protein
MTISRIWHDRARAITLLYMLFKSIIPVIALPVLLSTSNSVINGVSTAAAQVLFYYVYAIRIAGTQVHTQRLIISTMACLTFGLYSSTMVSPYSGRVITRTRAGYCINIGYLNIFTTLLIH